MKTHNLINSYYADRSPDAVSFRQSHSYEEIRIAYIERAMEQARSQGR